MDTKIQKEIRLFADESLQKIKASNLTEGDYCILITSDQITIRAYKSINSFLENVEKDTKDLETGVSRINWQIIKLH